MEEQRRLEVIYPSMALGTPLMAPPVSVRLGTPWMDN